MLVNTGISRRVRSTSPCTLDKIKITSSDPRYYLGISVKGLIASMDIKTIGRSNKNKKARYAINNVSLKYISDRVQASLRNKSSE